MTRLLLNPITNRLDLVSSSSSGEGVQSLTGNDDVIVAADAQGNVNVDGDGSYLTVMGNSGSHTETISPVNPLIVVLKSPLIDMTQIGPVLSFNVPHNFVIDDIFFNQVSLVDGTQAPVFSVGWTAPNYNDSGISNFMVPSYPAANGSFYNIYIAATTLGVYFPFPASTNIYINITTADVATMNKMYFYISGFFQF
jgi:hypothetical protein